MSLFPYLVAISRGRPINAHRFSALLDAKKIAMSLLGSAVYQKKNKYLFNVENKELFEQLLSKTSPPKSRYHATKQGDSHRHPTHCSYLPAKNSANDKEVICIACEPSNAKVEKSKFSSSTPIILIENSDCFTFSDDFLLAMELDELLDKALIILSSGNAITHKQSMRWLSSFDTVYYCPDYDLAGITIYETLCRHLSKHPTFVVPTNLAVYQQYCFKPKKPQKLLKAIEKVDDLGLPEQLKALFLQGRGFLEQEIFLGERNE